MRKIIPVAEPDLSGNELAYAAYKERFLGRTKSFYRCCTPKEGEK